MVYQIVLRFLFLIFIFSPLNSTYAVQCSGDKTYYYKSCITADPGYYINYPQGAPNIPGRTDFGSAVQECHDEMESYWEGLFPNGEVNATGYRYMTEPYPIKSVSMSVDGVHYQGTMRGWGPVSEIEGIFPNNRWKQHLQGSIKEVTWHGCSPFDEPEVTYSISISSIISPRYKNYITSMDPSLTKGLVAKVMGSDGNPGNIPVDMTVTAIEDTGGHDQAYHSARNPTHSGVLVIGSRKGASLNNITINGEQEFKFTSPKSSGDHLIEISCPNHTCTQTKPDKIWVGIKDLIDLPNSDLYNFIGFTNAHIENHYISELASRKIDNIAFVYKEDFPNDPILHINDISLERGGLFDISGKWKIPHETHNKGTEIDIRANENIGKTPGDVPKRNYKDFYRISKRHGCLAVREFADQPKEHFHLYCNEKYGKAE